MPIVDGILIALGMIFGGVIIAVSVAIAFHTVRIAWFVLEKLDNCVINKLRRDVFNEKNEMTWPRQAWDALLWRLQDEQAKQQVITRLLAGGYSRSD